jgi:putative two-component system response regulator
MRQLGLSWHTPRILVADDEPANVMLLEAFLKDSGDVWSVVDSGLVEHAFLDFEPDILLLDLHMPAPDGLEILQRLRSARASLGFLPVIMLTADVTRVARNTALLLGADDFLTKPLDRDDVVLRVRNLLRTRQLYAELVEANEALKRGLHSHGVAR